MVRQIFPREKISRTIGELWREGANVFRTMEPVWFAPRKESSPMERDSSGTRENRRTTDQDPSGTGHEPKSARGAD